jgi:hypothetical protein
MGKTMTMEDTMDIGFSECAVAWVVGRVHMPWLHFIATDSFFVGGNVNG